MQQYVHNQQISAYRCTFSVNDAEVKQIALWECPYNYAMQEYTYDMQLSAKRYMGNVTERELKTIALSEYTNDYSV
jgi:hypothetical protein